jgi:hypothetical protein
MEEYPSNGQRVESNISGSTSEHSAKAEKAPKTGRISEVFQIYRVGQFQSHLHVVDKQQHHRYMGLSLSTARMRNERYPERAPKGTDSGISTDISIQRKL